MDYYKWFKDGFGNRDQIFREVLSYFNSQPIKVLEIGTMRSIHERSSGGASTFFWAEYIKKNGGELHVCDTNRESLQFCSSVLSDFYNQTKFYLNTGTNIIESFNHFDTKWDLIYLDGGDDPKEMVDEFLGCHSKYVLCDDFYTKGAILRQIYPNHKLYKWKENNHELALYGENINKEIVYLEHRSEKQ